MKRCSPNSATVRSREIVLVKRTSKETVAAVEGTGLAGIYYARDSRRVYPYGSLACQVIGFSSSDGAGLTGIERQYDEYLAGVKGEIVYETDLVGGGRSRGRALPISPRRTVSA